MKFYISADIEGIAGVVTREQGGPQGFEYAEARRWMTAEVRAASEVVLENGFDEVIVSDSHGNGQNLLLDELPRGVHVVRSWPRPLSMMQGVETDGVTAAAFIGYHAGSTNMSGGLAHTMYGLVIQEVRVNGEVFSEAGISAATAGHFGVPIVLICGDDIFVEETNQLLGERTSVTTKRSHGTLSATTLLPSESCDAIRIGTAQAIENTNSVDLFVVDTPVQLQVEFKHRLVAELLEYLPFVDRVDSHTISHSCADMVALNKFMKFVTFYNPTIM